MVRPLLLGALLPDVTRFSVLLIDFFDWPAVPTFAYLIPFHSLLIVSLLAGAIALLFERPWRVFWLIQAGAALHFTLDELEGQIGCGSTTFYPLYFGKPLNLWPTEGLFAWLLLAMGGLGLAAALIGRSGWPPLALRQSSRRSARTHLYSALLVGAAVLIPWITRDWVVARNAYQLGFFAEPGAWEGNAVNLCFSEIISTDPITVEEFDTHLVLAPDGAVAAERPLAVGDWVSLRGVYQDGAIHPTLFVRHSKTADVLLSGLAGFAFILLWMPAYGSRPAVSQLAERQKRRA
jgi:hypothetical protein